jgi:hypothetical protein
LVFCGPEVSCMIEAALQVIGVERSGMKDVRKGERRVLEAAGWRSEDRAGETVWQNPESGYWYPQGVAIAMIREGANPGEVPKEPEGGA